MATYRLNEEKNGVEIMFDAKPAEGIRAELKENGFRWGNGFWWAKQTAERIELAKRLAGGEEWKDLPGATNAPKGMEWQSNGKSRFSGEYKHRLVPVDEPKGTPQDRIKIYYNGFRLNGDKKLTVRVWYYLYNDGTIGVSARNYDDLPREFFSVRNDTDLITDYIDNDRSTVDPAHPLYRFIEFAAHEQERKRLERDIKSNERYAAKSAKWGGNWHEYYTQKAEEGRAKLAGLPVLKNPGQPTAEDLAKIDEQRQREENEKREAEHNAAIQERERVLSEQHEGFEYINAIADCFPIEDGAPVVEIPFSENPAFYSFMHEHGKTITLHPDGTTTEEITRLMPRCVLSVTAADIVLNHFDKKRVAKNTEEGHGGYDKTDFIIKWTDESGEPWEYEGRYDLGDNDGGLIAHIKALAEYNRDNPKYSRIVHGDKHDEMIERRFAWVELLERYNKPLRLLQA